MIEGLVALGAVCILVVTATWAIRAFLAVKATSPKHKHTWEIVKVGSDTVRQNTLVYYRCIFDMPPATKTEWLTGQWTLEELRGDL